MRSAALIIAATGCAAYPTYLECSNDTATRLVVGGKGIMAGPATGCFSDTCGCTVSAKKKLFSHDTELTITTTAGMNFAVRVNDGAGTLSSTDSGIEQTPKCPGQMVSTATTNPQAGTWKVTLTPPPSGAKTPQFTVAYTDKFGNPVQIVTYPASKPVQTLFRCHDNGCVQSNATGSVPLDECKQFCGPPGGELFKCQANKCVQSNATGSVPLDTCKQLCG